MLYHIICDLIPFNVIVWYNSYFHMLYHIFHNVIPLFLTVYIMFTNLTNLLSLSQHVNFPTHINGNIIDIVLTSPLHSELMVSNISRLENLLLDHFFYYYN